MTTAVASPPAFQQLPRISWNGGSGSTGGLPTMSSEESSRMFIPTRKVVTRSNSTSSLNSNSSSTSTETITQTQQSQSSQVNGDTSAQAAKKKARGGFWPMSKAESTSGVSTARANGAVQTANPNGMNGVGVKNHLHNGTATAQAGPRGAAGIASSTEQTAILALLPMNGTFERKQINVPYSPEILKIGRQTNAKTVPTQSNGFFDSKVLSRQHAEIWADRNGKIWIRDVKSSNGTFVNGQRLSPENRESEPHELRQHDTLELGIDIVSEDQKTIVHHKVSAKVEFAGLPGASNNVLDLSFGDLDPSHGSSMLSSPMSQPMIQSRSRPGGLSNGRVSAASSVTGGQLSSLAQQRQATFWGTPFNVEQLVRHLSTEMRAAKQQAQDLETMSSFLGSMIPADEDSLMLQKPTSELHHVRQSSSKSRAARADPAARFGDPPAPPPQQPLPEKPDSAKSSPVSTSSPEKPLKRSETAKLNGSPHSPSHSQSQSQILSLVQALDVAKKELDKQNDRMKELEDLLKQERTAREAAEERARRVEIGASVRPVMDVEPKETTPPSSEEVPAPHDQEPAIETAEQILQARLDHVVLEMKKMRSELDQATKRAETAESDASGARASLADMITQLQKENQGAETTEQADSLRSAAAPPVTDDAVSTREQSSSKTKSERPHPNGHLNMPSKLPPQVERAVATVLRDYPGSMTSQSGPYVSMLGVVLIGVGLMAYLNSWQRGDK